MCLLLVEAFCLACPFAGVLPRSLAFIAELREPLSLAYLVHVGMCLLLCFDVFYHVTFGKFQYTYDGEISNCAQLAVIELPQFRCIAPVDGLEQVVDPSLILSAHPCASLAAYLVQPGVRDCYRVPGSV
jgi:hypothetical protein